ncbi:MAG: hypothetical protein HY706_02565 [Candidatus Hydrogenedentes bacterium]|nr:hypothetical protein [Candidatus Hydrogenedentota bacterium]
MLMLWVLTSLALLGGSEANLLQNADFAAGLEGWGTHGAGISSGVQEIEGRTAAYLTVPKEVPVGFPLLFQEIPVSPGEVLYATVEAMGRNTSDGYGAYLSLEFYDAQGQRRSYAQSEPAQRGSWSPLAVRSAAPESTVRARICLLLNGHGEAFFRRSELMKVGRLTHKPLSGPVALKVTRQVVCKNFRGFGVEDDGWFYNAENAGHGITDEDIAIREGRIQWMDPDWIRMFFWHHDWCPKDDWETFEFDSPNMRSHYRTLDLYQRLGARINVTGVEWGMEQPYAEPQRVARAIGALFEHLIRTKGYTCVQEWTLTNEPNTHFLQRGDTFERYAEIHRLVKEEFARRGLRVKITGSDDTNGLVWFARCLDDDTYFSTADFFASHRYFRYTDRELAGFFYDDRLERLKRKRPRKPFVVAEFGFQDERSGTLENPLMETYPYAVWTTRFVLDGLNRGVAGFCIWCLHEVYYPGNGFMNYGLWDFKDNNWKPRPVYYVWADFCRLTDAGMPVFKCESDYPNHVTGAVVGGTLFWVNNSDQAAEIVVSGFQGKSLRVYTESSLHGERECGETLTLERGRFSAPPQSFGYVR